MTSPALAYNAEQGIRRYAVEGLVPHPISVTSLLRVIAPATGLVRWLDKKLISSALEAYDKSQDPAHAISAGMEARFSGSPEADFGTSVHKLTEQADMKKLGMITEITPVADMKKASAFLRQWERMRDEFEMTILAVEATLVNTKLGYAGTADRIVIVPAISQDPLVLDIKSGKSVYPDVALQCAGLANCDKILHNDGKLEDIPWQLDKQHGAAAHVRARSGHIYPLDIAAAWPLFAPLPQLALWRAEQIEVVGDALTPDEDAQKRAALRLRIAELPMDLAKSLRDLIASRDDLKDGNTSTWTTGQLIMVDMLFDPFEKEARERLEYVLNNWGDRGEFDLRSRVLSASGGRTSQARELSAGEVDVLVKGFVEEDGT